MAIEANIICDSINEYDNRLTTFKLRYPKFIHGELMTHRVFSRNASSSRAIPSKKLRQEAWDPKLRATPVYWGKNQKGMSANESLEDWELFWAQWLWGHAARISVIMAWLMDKIGMHKQLVNRVLEPFTHINVLVTATEYMNFFGLRLHKDAQPEMRRLAELMWHEYEMNEPRRLTQGEWHLPYIDNPIFLNCVGNIEKSSPLDIAIKVSIARCARVSYESFETGKISTIEEDLKLFDRLLGAQPLHASPAEHQGTPDNKNDNGVWMLGHQHGNFVGFIQYRQTLRNQAYAPLPIGYH